MMRAHYHQHPSARGTRFGERADRLGRGAHWEFVAADSLRLQDFENSRIDHQPHALGNELASRIAGACVFRQRRRNLGYPPHDLLMIDVHQMKIHPYRPEDTRLRRWKTTRSEG